MAKSIFSNPIVSIGLLIFLVSPAHANLIINPSFEGAALGWTFSDGNPDTGGNGRDVGTCPSPCTITRTGSWAGFKNLFDGGSGTISQAVQTVVGHTYLVEVWLADNTFENGTVTVSFGSTEGVQATQNDTSTTYRQYSFTHVATSESTEFVFGGLVTSGTFFIDDVSVIDLDSPAVEYRYQGPNFSLFSCAGDTICEVPDPSFTSYSTSNNVTATITLDQPLLPNLVLEDVRGLPGFSLSISDGLQVLTSPSEVLLSTNADGDIVPPWSVISNGPVPPNNGVATTHWEGVRGIADVAALSAPTTPFPDIPRDQGYNFQNPGQWSGIFEDVFILSQTLNPTLPGFGRPVALDGNTALVASLTGAGTALSFNILGGTFVRNFDNPNPSASGAVPTDFYGTTIAASNGRVLIGAEAEDIAAIDSGAAYLFDTNTGSLLQTFTHPTPADPVEGFGQNFGRGIALDGDQALIGTFLGDVFLFDVLTGDLLFTFPDLRPSFESLDLAGQFAAIGDVTNATGAFSAGAVFLFDRITGSNIRTFFNPTPNNFDFFGESVSIDEGRILIGTGNAAEAYLFDVNSGVLLRTLTDPTPDSFGNFGRDLDLEGDLIVVSEEGASEVHIFDAVSGNHLQTLTEQTSSGFFGVSIDLDQRNLLVGSIGGPAFVYSTQGAANGPPTAEAGPDQAVRAGDIVFLDGSASFDDNTATASLVYSWSFLSLPAGSNAVLQDADTALPTFFVDVEGTYSIQLVVTDGSGLASTPDEVIISSDNLAPTADAGLGQLIIVNSTAFLDGSGSTDPEGDPLTYSWMISGSPAGSITTLLGDDTVSPSFIPDLEGAYEITLTVSDLIGPSTPDRINITVVSSDEFAVISIVSADQTIVTLDPVQVTTEGNQNALGNFLSQATTAIQSGDIAEAIDKLQKAISRTDGCVLRGDVDMNGPGRDWVTDCASQITLYESLNQALAAIQP